MKNIEGIIDRIEALKPISPVVHRILDIAGRPDGSVAELVEVVQYDPALTANLLKMCNSAYYGLPVHVDSVHHAVSLLGTNEVIELVMMKGAGESLLREQKGYGLQRGALWKHSVASALLARSFAAGSSRSSDRFLLYTASLLRDIGKVVIEDHVGRSLSKIRRMVEKKEVGFDQAEQEVLGIDHAKLGALIAEKWRFSPRMVYLIGNHHLSDPASRSDFEAVIVYLADTVSQMALAGIGADNLAYRVYGEVFGDLGVCQDDLQRLSAEFHANLHVAERLLLSL